MAPLRLGTRGSALALAQANLVAEALDGAEVVPITSERGGDKRRFVSAIEDALLAGEIDLAVHSAKDLPADLPDGLEIVGVPAREDPADAFVGEFPSLDEVPEGAAIGTASLRRRAQLLARRPDLNVRELHGNVDTRLGRLREGDFDGIVLAAAGLRRLGREDEISFLLTDEDMTPAAGQGALALQARSGDEAAIAAAESLTDRQSLTELIAERTVVAELDATCRTPIGVRARVRDGLLEMSAFVGLPDGSEWIRDRLAVVDEPACVGEQLAERLVATGARDLLERAEAT